MALRGVWQLHKLIVSYCNWGGSSRGIRAFMESQLPIFKEKNPPLEVVTELIRGQHPHLKGFLQEQKSASNMCEEYGSRRHTFACNQTKECIGKKGSEIEDKTCNQTP